MERVFAPGLGTPEIDSVSITWKSPELLDINVQIDSLVKMRKDAPGLWSDDFYQRKIGQLMGMSKTDIQSEIDAAGEQQAIEDEKMAEANNQNNVDDQLVKKVLESTATQPEDVKVTANAQNDQRVSK